MATLIVSAFPASRRFVARVWHLISRYRPKVPRETIRITPQQGLQRWSEATVGGRPATGLDGRFHVVNILADRAVKIVGAEIAGHPAEIAHVFTQHAERDIYSAEYVIPASRTTKVSTTFYIVPPVTRLGRDFKATLVLIDQFGNRHKHKTVFRAPPPPPQLSSQRPREALHTITDTIEKEAAAVLKAEVQRYEDCGRRVSGLGSLRASFQGRTYPGLAPEWRDVGSMQSQSILAPGESVITSDNADTLIGYFARLSTDEEKDRFMNALLSRLSRSTEYAPIGYFIFFVLFKLGRGEAALWKSKSDLRGDASYGFSDVLRLLDGMLRADHPAFSDSLLDSIERLTEGLDEHAFRIPERIAAIRAYRLRGTPSSS